MAAGCSWLGGDGPRSSVGFFYPADRLALLRGSLCSDTCVMGFCFQAVPSTPPAHCHVARGAHRGNGLNQDSLSNGPSDPMKPCRWFRFSLRTLLVLMTVFCVWLGMQWNWIRDRRAYLSEHPNALRAPTSGDTVASAPGLLRIFGERGATRVVVVASDYAARHRRVESFPEAIEARRLFPEAKIEVIEGKILWSTWFPGKPFGWNPPGSISIPKSESNDPNNPFD